MTFERFLISRSTLLQPLHLLLVFAWFFYDFGCLNWQSKAAQSKAAQSQQQRACAAESKRSEIGVLVYQLEKYLENWSCFDYFDTSIHHNGSAAS